MVQQIYIDDPYKILGISNCSTLVEIKRAYRLLARKRHPDLDKDNPWAEGEFRTISNAYEFLSNQKTRAQYDRGEIDRLGARIKKSAPKRANKSKSAYELKESSPKLKQKKYDVKINGADIKYNITMSFLESIKGENRIINTTNGKRLKVNIPAGINDAITLRLKGQGMLGFNGGQPGDALVEITVLDDHMVRRVEKDIFLDLPITLPEAVLGAKVDVPTIDGLVTMTIPAASNTGTVLRLKAKGLPFIKKLGEPQVRGDQYITLQVILPKKKDKEFIDFIKSWSMKNTYKVNRKK